jgi:hypothetical protein
MESHFQLAVLGQFKRGKSTFINALLGAPVLPAAVVPLTAIATFIAWGAYPLIKVTYQGGRLPEEVHPTDLHSIQERIRDFVAEERNPANVHRVSRVDLFLPAEILENGLVLIDTPGIGSTLQHNTDTALRALPECDAAMFVVSPDPPITEAEITYLARVRTHVVNVFFVLNKIDYLDAADRACGRPSIPQSPRSRVRQSFKLLRDRRLMRSCIPTRQRSKPAASSLSSRRSFAIWHGRRQRLCASLSAAKHVISSTKPLAIFIFGSGPWKCPSPTSSDALRFLRRRGAGSRANDVRPRTFWQETGNAPRASLRRMLRVSDRRGKITL